MPNFFFGFYFIHSNFVSRAVTVKIKTTEIKKQKKAFCLYK